MPRPDVIVLVWSIPIISDGELLSERPRRGITVPIAFLTGHTLTTNENRPLDFAFDFIGNERGIAVLVGRPGRHPNYRACNDSSRTSATSTASSFSTQPATAQTDPEARS